MKNDLYEIHWSDSYENLNCTLFDSKEKVCKFLDDNHLRRDDVFIFVPKKSRPIVATDFE